MKIEHLGRTQYQDTWAAMQKFTDTRDHDTLDELWVCEHESVYTLGQAGKHEHILNPADIPIVQSDRGGQVTYHGPGQMLVYTLFNLRKAGYGIREMVVRLENSVIALLAEYGCEAHSRRSAPGVYVHEDKVAALGLRVRKGCAYHGIALNIDPDLKPFLGINPCGFEGLGVTSIEKLGITFHRDELSARFVALVQEQLLAKG